MKEEAMEHGTRQDAENMLQNMLNEAVKAERKARFKLTGNLDELLGIDEKADE
jgi:hypothetical protein